MIPQSIFHKAYGAKGAFALNRSENHPDGGLATISHSEKECLRKLLALMLHHNLVTRLTSMGFCITFEACSFMSCFKSVVCMSKVVGLRIGSIDPSGNSALAKTEIELKVCKICNLH